MPILGDTEVEPDEPFYLVLQNPIGATLTDDYAHGHDRQRRQRPGNNRARSPRTTPTRLSEDYPLSVNGFGVLANDYDPERRLCRRSW